jgi:cation transport ATPase
MTSEQPEYHSTEDETLHEDLDQPQERNRHHEKSRSRPSPNSWIVGAVLILAGLLLALQNITSFSFNNWWALFILIPAFASYGSAWRAYQRDERLSAPVRSSLTTALILTLVAAFFLFNFNWTIFGPIVLILVGIGLLINVVVPRES